MNKIEIMEKLVESYNGELVDLKSITQPKQLFNDKEQKKVQKELSNCSNPSCKKLIRNLKDLRFYFKYNLCETCYLKLKDN